MKSVSKKHKCAVRKEYTQYVSPKKLFASWYWQISLANLGVIEEASLRLSLAQASYWPSPELKEPWHNGVRILEGLSDPQLPCR